MSGWRIAWSYPIRVGLFIRGSSLEIAKVSPEAQKDKISFCEVHDVVDFLTQQTLSIGRPIWNDTHMYRLHSLCQEFFLATTYRHTCG